MHADSGCLIRVGDKTSSTIMFSVNNGKFVLTGIERSLPEDILTFDVDDVDDFPSPANAKEPQGSWQHSRFRSFALQNASNSGKHLGIVPLKLFEDANDTFKIKKLMKPFDGPITLSTIPENIPHLHVWDINITSRQSGIRVGVIFEDETLPISKRICYISSRKLDIIHICGVDYPVDDLVSLVEMAMITVVYNSEVETLSFYLNLSTFSVPSSRDGYATNTNTAIYRICIRSG